MIYLKLFFSFLKIGMFSVGGGYAAMPLIQSEVVSGHGWLSMGEFTDLITIAEMTPGPIAVNSATFVGIRIAGVPGAFAATFGCIFPSCIIVSLLAFIYRKYKNVSVLQNILAGLRPAVVALIARDFSPARGGGGGSASAAGKYELGGAWTVCGRALYPEEMEVESDSGDAAVRDCQSGNRCPYRKGIGIDLPFRAVAQRLYPKT